MTSLLCFHPFEPVLVVCGRDEISVWDVDIYQPGGDGDGNDTGNGNDGIQTTHTPTRKISFRNGHPPSSRLTCVHWI
eukprot:CAMPEP_0194409376 /NCGR_PEP_ID=MMETSP0176-20130528/7255_1 /TAXON_ID=216777 /ORGANISM="Proboscia alata, Strain PI-D3" /LENGTH=76 /DNA_ID=CAMNT_0039209961 /DNA_START=213 /DNA_END=440 /DNA_ORIENTATION=+